MSKRLYVVAGEHSGDNHGAGLLAELQQLAPGLSIQGHGGPKMAEVTGGAVRDWLEGAAVMGLWEVIKRYGWFKERMEEMVAEIVECRPDVLLLVDYPGFNLRLAARIREVLPEIKIIDFISPQVWAWKKGRIPKMAELLDRMICLFPFEQKIFEEAGLETVCCGHPMLDEIPDPAPTREPDLVALLPGSRMTEIRRLLPTMLEAGLILQECTPGRELRFHLAAASEHLAETIREELDRRGLAGPEWEVRREETRDLMSRAAVGAVASGTASLEAAILGLPYCLVYRIAPATYAAARVLVDIPHIGMANVLAGRAIVKELIQDAATPEALAAELQRLLRDPVAREEVAAAYGELRSGLGESGAYRRAAAAVGTSLEEG